MFLGGQHRSRCTRNGASVGQAIFFATLLLHEDPPPETLSGNTVYLVVGLYSMLWLHFKPV
jgi:hypothetical protein